MTGDGVSDGRNAADDRSPLPPVTSESPPSAPLQSGDAAPAPPFFGSEPERRAGAGGEAEADDPAPLDLGEVAEVVEAGGDRSSDRAPDSRAAEADALASRLEALAARIRRDGEAALDAGLASRDRLDALLAAVLAGYRAGSDP